MLDKETFINSAIAGILWSTSSDNGMYETLEGFEWDPESLERFKECAGKFYDENETRFERLEELRVTYDYEQHGISFVLNCNGHGSGFWARIPCGSNEGDLIYKQLSNECMVFGAIEIYLWDDNLVHFHD